YLFLSMCPLPASSTLFPYTTLFRSQPVRVGRVVAHDVLVEQVGGRGQAHRRAGVAAADLLDGVRRQHTGGVDRPVVEVGPAGPADRKSTRLNSSHVKISYAVFCLKK